MEAEEALTSPRVGEFLGNPFHLPQGSSFERDEIGQSDPSNRLTPNSSPRKEVPVTPTSSDSDPRSPAQFGISPITRNIWGMI